MLKLSGAALLITAPFVVSAQEAPVRQAEIQVGATQTAEEQTAEEEALEPDMQFGRPVGQPQQIEPTTERAPEAPTPTEITLPANSEVVLRMAEEITTKGGRAKVGQTFRLTVAYDVRVDGVTVIPMGTPAVGEITMKTGRAVFGKSGKMEIELRSINLDGQRVEITGSYRQEGDGDTLAAVGAVVLAAPLLVITGKSAVIPRGRELIAHTVSPLTVPVS